MKRLTFACWCFSAISLLAQSGDNKNEVQTPPAVALNVPPAPPLSIEDALKSFRLQPGFQIEVVASEPMIEAPVEIEFDPDGRLYVLEMRGFMPNVDGTGEDQPLGRISLLEDTNGDGRMDKNIVFADNLVMPRAMAIVRGGLLVAEPPHLWFLKDDDGDGKAESKEEVSSDYGNQANPEHTANGLLWARDNWIYSANHNIRYRNIRGYWEKEATQSRGQWGITQDDYGRLFFNSNSDQFRGDLVPGNYLLRNPHFKASFGANVQIAHDQSTYPIRINAGVNRGYQKGTLRADGTLAQFTAACGPCLYRGDLFPRTFYGTAFLCEPSANLVRCNLLRENEGTITATNAFGKSEFLASTDERFRPVNISNGPDGALYIVDLYRGVIQHRIYVTTYLRNQILSRNLEAPLNMGRIYRVVPAGPRRATVPKLSQASSEDLVKQLSAANGSIRDTAQRLLVERNDFQALDAIQQTAAKGDYPSAIHALWVLNAVGELNTETLSAALRAADPKVRATAVRISEAFLRAEGKNELSERIMALAKDPSAEVQLQVMFSLGESKAPAAEAALLDLLDRNIERPLVRDAAISGLTDREGSLLAKLASRPGWSEKTPGREKVIRDLSQCVAESRRATDVNHLIDLAGSIPHRWQQYAILDGIAALAPKSRGKTPAPLKPLRLASEPSALVKLKADSDAGLSQRLARLDPLLVWPGKPGYQEPQVTPLTAEEKGRFEAGKNQYAIICGACHQPTGLGLEGLAPPLVDSEWVNGTPERLARIVLNGMRGKISVKGKTWELEMPPLNVLSDQDIASALTYIRREWEHTASPVTPDLVTKVRAQTAGRQSAWTEAELLKIE